MPPVLPAAGRLLLGLGLVLGSGVPPVEEGRFGPNYQGGDAFRYDDPSALPLPFAADDASMTCPGSRNSLASMRGVSLGSYLVLEPWQTPSLFYQFLGADEARGAVAPRVGVDLLSFCEALGPAEGNRQLRRHWAAWMRAEDMAKLAALGLDTVRIPVGDWMWRPYGAYAGCTNGSIAELDRAIGLAHAHGLKVLIDLHGVEMSQNGFDNSGNTSIVRWAADRRTFSYAPLASNWIGPWDEATQTYSQLNWARVVETLDVVRAIAERYAYHPAIIGVEPLNEPWMTTPIGPLKRFYWESFKIIKRRAPHWVVLLSDSFRHEADSADALWGRFLRGCPDAGLDLHMYLAFGAQPATAEEAYVSACERQAEVGAFAARGIPIVVGEWSLATDLCAMWLTGFNNNHANDSTARNDHCAWAPCAEPYMGRAQPGAPPDRGKGPRGPFADPHPRSFNTPVHGMCPIDRTWSEPSDDVVMPALAQAQLSAWLPARGWFFWGHRTELVPKWDYIRAAERGWLPSDAQAPVHDSCPAILRAAAVRAGSGGGGRARSARGRARAGAFEGTLGVGAVVGKLP